MIEPGTEQVGCKVIYTPFPGCDPSLKEEGVIMSWNKVGIWVRYGIKVQPEITGREDLEYLRL